MSNFELPGYLDSENLWQKIMDIDIGLGKPKTKQNMKVNERIIRADEMIYVTPFDKIFESVFLTDYISYKQYIKNK